MISSRLVLAVGAQPLVVTMALAGCLSPALAGSIRLLLVFEHILALALLHALAAPFLLALALGTVVVFRPGYISFESLQVFLGGSLQFLEYGPHISGEILI